MAVRPTQGTSVPRCVVFYLHQYRTLSSRHPLALCHMQLTVLLRFGDEGLWKTVGSPARGWQDLQRWSDVLRCTHLLYTQLNYAANPHCFALLKVVEVIATEEWHQLLENVMGCTVCFTWFATCEKPFKGIELFCSTCHMHMQIFISDVHVQSIKTSIKPITVMLQHLVPI